MLQAASADTKKATARGNSQPPAAPGALQAPPVPVLGNQATLRLMRKCDCGGAPDCDCDMGDDKKKKEKDSPRTALHRKPFGSGELPAPDLLDAETQSFFEARLQRKQQRPVAPSSSGPSIRIGAVDDPFEREADQIVDPVMRMPMGAVVPSQQPRAPETGNPLRRKPGSAASQTEAPPIVHAVLSSPGQPLDKSTRAFFESRLGYPLSNVRIHPDQRGADSARSISARAYTMGEHIVFREGEYAPASEAGRRLLAHELTHVVQQTSGTAGPASTNGVV